MRVGRPPSLPAWLPASPPPLSAVCAAQPRRKRSAVSSLLLLLPLPLTLLRMSVRGSRHAATPLSPSRSLCLTHSPSFSRTHALSTSTSDAQRTSRFLLRCTCLPVVVVVGMLLRSISPPFPSLCPSPWSCRQHRHTVCFCFFHITPTVRFFYCYSHA